MAIGAALVFNIVLPINFNSPYKALDIQDFWRRWHITLSRFLTQYIYIPLGGNRRGKVRTYLNIMIIFLISGFWHGAGWTFIFWGFLHGFATVLNRYWKSFNYKLNKVVAWLITFNFVNISWVFFRANTWEEALNVLKGMFGFNGIALPTFLKGKFEEIILYDVMFIDFFAGSHIDLIYLLLFFLIVLYYTFKTKNSYEYMTSLVPNKRSMLFVSIIFIYSILNFHKISEFLYFNF